nr:MAG: major capsid protein [Microviridae sp.]
MTPKFPTMDNAKLDTFFFFVPNRLVWDHWKEFLGENNSSEEPWTQPMNFKVPQMTVPLFSNGNNRTPSDLANYLGIPYRQFQQTGLNQMKVSALPFRMVAKVWNDWFRDENYQLPCHIYTDETVPQWNVTSGANYVTGVEMGVTCPPVNRYKDYFSSCLPQPQKGAAVELPLGEYAPLVQGKGNDVPFMLNGAETSAAIGVQGVGKSVRTIQSGTSVNFSSTPLTMTYAADLSNATAASVNALRLAFATQRFLEASARGGTRYTELLLSMFGANAPDASLQRSEFLGGKSFPLSITPVTNIGQSDSLGTVGGMSNTVSGDYAFKKHFTEHGYILGFCCVRTDRSYSQGIARHWMRKEKTDFYFPVFANIGETPVKNYEIYATGSATGNPSTDDDNPFGYQEAWAEYRFAQNEATGLLRSGIPNSLNAWTYTDEYTSLPVLNSAWLTSQKEIIDRTIVNQNEHQFIADFFFDDVSYRVLPAYSIPGLIDHG